jgi:nucleoside-diphosphate-sugar epimerase
MADTLDIPLKPVLVLGASGFIGRNVVAALERDRRYQPIAASRRLKPGVQSVDATNPDALRSALRNVEYVVNCVAGNNSTMIASAQTLCDASRRDPPRRIVHLSSMAVYGAATGSIVEDQAAVGPVSTYGDAKIASEKIMQKYVVDGGDAVVLRPTCVFGPGSSQWTIRLGRLLQSGRLGDLGPSGDGCCNMAFIDDLVAGVVAALDVPDISGRVFNISSSSTLTWNEFLMRFAYALDATPVRRIPGRMLKIETKLLAPARRLASIGLRRVGLPVGEAITPSLLALMGQHIRVEFAAAAETLGLPQTSVERMLTIAARWLRGEESTPSHSNRWMEPVRP